MLYATNQWDNAASIEYMKYDATEINRATKYNGNTICVMWFRFGRHTFANRDMLQEEGTVPYGSKKL
jgi:hypothetical protein